MATPRNMRRCQDEGICAKLENGVVPLEFGCVGIRSHFTTLHEQHPIGHGKGDPDMLLHDNDGRAALRPPPEEFQYARQQRLREPR